jgi:hypothetical protein
MDRVEHVPSHRALDAIFADANREWIAERGVRDAVKLKSDLDAARLVLTIMRLVNEAGYDTDNDRTMNRILVKLGLSGKIAPRPPHVVKL